MNDRVTVGIVMREHDFQGAQGRLGELADEIVSAGIDHITVGDHVSFANGHGTDGIVQATALLSAHHELNVQTGVYLLTLRHPATVARQLSTLSLVGPGRFTFGVGVGGDDPAELELCGVDPRTRGARMNEALACVRELMTGDEVTFRGRFFSFEASAIRPAPSPPVPILVGGRSDAALARTARLGEGWLALWVSPRRYAEGVATIAAAAAEAGRDHGDWLHTLQLWAGFDSTRERAVARTRITIERAYSLPFERFERYTPCGPADQVAESLQPYLALGCRRFNIVAEAPRLEDAVHYVAAVKRSLQGETPRAVAPSH